MWQEVIVGLIAIVVLLYVGRRLYRMVKHAQEKTCGCGCAGCNGCSAVKGNLDKHFSKS